MGSHFPQRTHPELGKPQRVGRLITSDWTKRGYSVWYLAHTRTHLSLYLKRTVKTTKRYKQEEEGGMRPVSQLERNICSKIRPFSLWCLQHVDGICLRSARWHTDKWTPPVLTGMLLTSVWHAWPDVHNRSRLMREVGVLRSSCWRNSQQHPEECSQLAATWSQCSGWLHRPDRRRRSARDEPQIQQLQPRMAFL